MALLAVALVALAAVLWARRSPATASVAWTEAPRSLWVAPLGVAVSFTPLLWRLPRLLSLDALLPADAQAHAWVAQELARVGLPHGWVDVCAAGFPFGPEYQSVTLLVAALLVKCGIPVTTAVQALGIGAILTIPLLLAALLQSLGVRPAAAIAGGAVAAWSAMPFVYAAIPDTYLAGGVVSQSVALVIIVGTAWAVVAGPAWSVPTLAALAVASHALLGVLALAVSTPAVLSAARPNVRRRFAWAAVGAAIAATAIYGPALRARHLPVGWSRGSHEELLSFPHHDIPALLTGDLLDFGRAPGFTACVLVACIGMLGALDRARVRGAFTLLASVLFVSWMGRLLGTASLNEVFSPPRAVAFVPLAAGVAVSVGLDAWSRILPNVPVRRWLAWAVALGVLGWGTWTRWPWLRERLAIEDEMRGDHECGTSTPAGYRTSDVAGWLPRIAHGRFVVDVASFALARGVPLTCPSLHGLELASPEPLGASSGGPGSQNGPINDAFDQLALTEPGADGRAESLGVRTVLHTRAFRPTGAWQPIATQGDVELSERRGGTTFIGVACIRRVWRGDERALRDKLFDPNVWPDLLRDPASLTAIETSGGDTRAAGGVETLWSAADGCDADGARVDEVPREPGAYEATVTLPHDADIVVRATAFPHWRMTVDGEAVPTRTVLPGFFAARVTAGTHRVQAEVSLPPFYGAGLAGAGCILVVLSIWAAGVRRRVTAATGSPP